MSQAYYVEAWREAQRDEGEHVGPSSRSRVLCCSSCRSLNRCCCLWCCWLGCYWGSGTTLLISNFYITKLLLSTKLLHYKIATVGKLLNNEIAIVTKLLYYKIATVTILVLLENCHCFKIGTLKKMVTLIIMCIRPRIVLIRRCCSLLIHVLHVCVGLEQGKVRPTSCKTGQLTCSMGLDWMVIFISMSKAATLCKGFCA